ncbi:hypothetical protein L1F30_11545 [Simiduia sp. 21SJ11W-1]|uniref:hypothetical protein n=1 Tax=Simiduia sp. 21SJ11W-1 TaxID=2909669 RepID=UPI0020A149C3|nr:hypothetical protein [Simiduia sp. 21SJ11W-1]UTA46793.1 hypothetical protein L1F30_11545 [Simiduia sp. 21SJ11W-1]
MHQATFHRTLADYFRDRLHHLAGEAPARPQTDTLWYLGSMMARLGDSRELFSYEDGQLDIRPLALLYQDARDTQAHWERCQLLRQLGDLAMFLGALFPASFSRRGIGKDYVIGMGTSAYDYLADHASSNRHIFSELASRFAKLLELVAKACNREAGLSAEDLLIIYDRYRTTGDPQLARQLRALGLALPATEQLQ